MNINKYEMCASREGGVRADGPSGVIWNAENIEWCKASDVEAYIAEVNHLENGLHRYPGSEDSAEVKSLKLQILELKEELNLSYSCLSSLAGKNKWIQI